MHESRERRRTARRATVGSHLLDLGSAAAGAEGTRGCGGGARRRRGPHHETPPRLRGPLRRGGREREVGRSPRPQLASATGGDSRARAAAGRPRPGSTTPGSPVVTAVRTRVARRRATRRRHHGDLGNDRRTQVCAWGRPAASDRDQRRGEPRPDQRGPGVQPAAVRHINAQSSDFWGRARGLRSLIDERFHRTKFRCSDRLTGRDLDQRGPRDHRAAGPLRDDESVPPRFDSFARPRAPLREPQKSFEASRLAVVESYGIPRPAARSA